MGNKTSKGESKDLSKKTDKVLSHEVLKSLEQYLLSKPCNNCDHRNTFVKIDFMLMNCSNCNILFGFDDTNNLYQVLDNAADFYPSKSDLDITNDMIKKLNLKNDDYQERIEVKNINDLQPGNHIGWESNLGLVQYIHHVIVEKVHKQNNEIVVIHFSNNKLSKREKFSNQKLFTKAKIIRENISNIFEKFGPIFLFNYSNCDSNEKVLERARFRIGDTRYNILFKNCEHFAYFCKTGLEYSRQVSNFVNMHQLNYDPFKTNYYNSRTKINSLDQLKPGDHIFWNRRIDHRHHALVTDVLFDKNIILVIHYVKNFLDRCKVVESGEKFDNKMKNELNRVEYKDGYYDNKEAIRRARSRLGETKYNLLSNNCEIFVRDCKTPRLEGTKMIK